MAKDDKKGLKRKSNRERAKRRKELAKEEKQEEFSTNGDFCLVEMGKTISSNGFFLQLF
jgi:hypothetical protein